MPRLEVEVAAKIAFDLVQRQRRDISRVHTRRAGSDDGMAVVGTLLSTRQGLDGFD